MNQKLSCAKSFDAALFMGESWSANDEDERANQLREIDVSAIALVSCFEKSARLPTGEQCLQHLKDSQCVRLSGRAILAFWEHQETIPNGWKKPLLSVFFDGLILTHRNGHRYSLYLSWHAEQWYWYSCWLGNTRGANALSATLPLM